MTTKSEELEPTMIVELSDTIISDDSEESSSKSKGGCCGFFRDYTITSILIFMVLGIGLGVGLSYWEPENPEDKDTAIQWVGVFGDMFLWALVCFVLPLVFVNIIISIVDMMSVGKAMSIGWTVIAMYLITTVAAAFFGTMSTLIFMNFYNTEETETDDTGNNSTLSEEPTMTEVSISDTIYQGIFQKIVPNNFVQAFANNEFTQVMFIGGVIGAALHPQIGQGGEKLMELLKQMDKILQRIIRWIIFLTPFAVFSLIAKGFGKVNDLASTFSNIGLLMAAAFLAWGLQILFIYVGLFALLTRSNPFTYLKKIVPAQLFAFSTASSAATIPQSIKSVRSTGVVPDVIGRFVVPFGATVNMDGGAVYFVCACIWLAVLNGEDVTAANFLLLIIIATMGSIGTAPVPSASLVLIITAYNNVFGGSGTPNGFAYILAIDWFMDRCRTVTNVTGDCIVTGIVAHRCPIEDEEEKRSEPTDKKDDSSSSNEEEDNITV